MDEQHRIFAEHAERAPLFAGGQVPRQAAHVAAAAYQYVFNARFCDEQITAGDDALGLVLERLCTSERDDCFCQVTVLPASVATARRYTLAWELREQMTPCRHARRRSAQRAAPGTSGIEVRVGRIRATIPGHRASPRRHN